jgi:hypothetical protein
VRLGSATMAMVAALLTDTPKASVTVSVMLEVPEAVGVPLIRPVDASSVRPARRLPALILQLYGALPPVRGAW